MATAKTKEQLLRATREAVRDVGLAGATAREITDRAGANLAAIPYHFGSKDQLVAEALIAEVRELIGPVLEVLESDGPASERATAAAALMGSIFEASRQQVPVYLAALSIAPHAAAVADGLAGLWAEVRGAVAADIDRQLAAGTLPRWVDSQAMASLILSLVNGVVISSVVDPDGPGHHAVAAQFLSLLVAALPSPELPEQTSERSGRRL